MNASNKHYYICLLLLLLRCCYTTLQSSSPSTLLQILIRWSLAPFEALIVDDGYFCNNKPKKTQQNPKQPLSAIVRTSRLSALSPISVASRWSDLSPFDLDTSRGAGTVGGVVIEPCWGIVRSYRFAGPGFTNKFRLSFESSTIRACFAVVSPTTAPCA